MLNKKLGMLNKLRQDGVEMRNFPGQQTGATVAQVRNEVKRQHRVKGYNFTVPTGNTPYPIQLTGDARQFLGLTLFPTKPAAPFFFTEVTSFTFKINNEIIVEDLNPNLFTSYFDGNDYFPLPRPLSGTDQITIEFKNPGASEVVSVALYYI